MNNNGQDLIVKYIQRQLLSTNERLHAIAHDRSTDKPYPRRHIFVKVREYITNFQNRIGNLNFVVITGLRGVGKTTILAQICQEVLKYKKNNQEILFISLIEAVKIFNATLSEVLQAFEEVIGDYLEKTDKEIYLFLDEVQKDPNWAATLHALFEKNKNIFICCTGSSAVLLQTNADIARRAQFEKLPPLSFPEYQMIVNRVYPVVGLKQKIKEALYGSKDAKNVYDALLGMRSDINRYWSRVNRLDIDKFLKVGTLPFALTIPKEEAIYDTISFMIDKLITNDLLEFGKFDTDTLGAVKRLLFILAGNDTSSVHQLERVLGIKRLTIQNLLDAIEKTELLVKVPAYGVNMTMAKKPAKYLFMTPAIRMSFFRMTGNGQVHSTWIGKLLEDFVGAHLYREFETKGRGKIRYDSEEGGADFVLQIENSKQIVIEVGKGKKDTKQVVQTMNKTKSDYGLIYASNELLLNEENNVVFVPLDYVFMM